MSEFERLRTRIPSGVVTVTNVKDITAKTGVEYTVLEYRDLDGRAQTFAKAQEYRTILRNLKVGERVNIVWEKGSHVPKVEQVGAAKSAAPAAPPSGQSQLPK